MTPAQWRQVTITFADPDTAEQVAIAQLGPILAEAEARGLITTWFYMRKGDWRLRYLPAPGTSAADRYLAGELERLSRTGSTRRPIPGIYEPETHAFGGPKAMGTAHRLWHHDSRHLLSRSSDGHQRHRELSIMLCAAMMRAANLDWYEQGDVWARVADHREPPDQPRVQSLHAAVKRLLTVDPASLTRTGAALAACRTLLEAYDAAGADLGRLNRAGELCRGLRATLAHHVIFAWNRRGIPGQHQAALATAAKTVIFGPDPTLEHPPTRR
jgi:thiopeptide-type bacteriocin biosynthesis protein